MPTVLKSGNLSLLETSGSVQACNGFALPLPLPFFTNVIFTFDDKIQSIKRCKLSAVVITVQGSNTYMRKAKLVRNFGEMCNVL